MYQSTTNPEVAEQAVGASFGRAAGEPARTSFPTQQSVRPVIQSKQADSGVIQRARMGKDDAYINKKKAVRVFGDSFASKHIRDASNYSSYSDMVAAGVEMMRRRGGSGVSGSTLIFMGAVGMGTFLEQEHTDTQDGYFESTTQFAIVEIGASMTMTVYSAAKFTYTGHWDDNTGLFVITHFGHVSSGDAIESGRVVDSKYYSKS